MFKDLLNSILIVAFCTIPASIYRTDWTLFGMAVGLAASALFSEWGK